MESAGTLESNGTVVYWPQVNIFVDNVTVVGTNKLSTGFVVDPSWLTNQNDSFKIGLTKSAGFKLVRVFSNLVEPCSTWNESTRTGVFDWATVDSVLNKTFQSNAEPLITIGFYDWSTGKMAVPQGMTTNSSTGLPGPESFAAYSTEWVKHFKAVNLPVRYYELVNEPHHYFGWNGANLTRLSYYVDLWNITAESMRSVNPNILISQDTVMQKTVMSYWLQHGDNVDFLDFHKYDSDYIGECNDSQLFNRAENWFFETSSTFLGVYDAQNIWYNARGKLIPIILSEFNLDSACVNGTDPRIQQMAGAVYTALVLKTAVQKGLSYAVYLTFSSSASWESKARSSGGLGFGMINSDNNHPWYPYYVQEILANNLAMGDSILNVTSSSNDISVMGWKHSEKLNILVISKVDDSRTLRVVGPIGEMNFTKIDNAISWQNPSSQLGFTMASKALVTTGYTIMLIQADWE